MEPFCPCSSGCRRSWPCSLRGASSARAPSPPASAHDAGDGRRTVLSRVSLLGLSKRFGDVAAIDDVTLDIADGAFVCLLGPSGCGKSTLLRLIGGFEVPDSGDIGIDGASIVGLPPNRRPTGMVFQSHALWPHMTVERNIAVGLTLRRPPAAEVRRKIAAALDVLGLAGLGRRYP